jgi:hypothetical protein
VRSFTCSNDDTMQIKPGKVTPEEEVP